MQKINLDNIPIQKNITFLSETCDKHKYIKDGKEQIKKVQLMMIYGRVACPLCESDKRKKEIEDEVYALHKDHIEYPNKHLFFRESIVVDETILKARFDNFLVEIEEEAENLKLAQQSAQDFTNSKSFTLWLQGKPGSGKSHLAYSLAYKVNEVGEYKVLFVDMSELLKRIIATFNNKSDETEQSIVRKLMNVDLLVLDDIGAEVGNIDTNKVASDFVSRVVFAIFNGRQGKCTIATTNLSGKQMRKIYDAKTFSRMFRDYRYIKFEKSKDRRFVELPF